MRSSVKCPPLAILGCTALLVAGPAVAKDAGPAPASGAPKGSGDPSTCPPVPSEVAEGAVSELPVSGGLPGDRAIYTVIRAKDVDVEKLTCGIDARLFLPGDHPRLRGLFVKPWSSKVNAGLHIEESFRPHGFGVLALLLRHEPAEWHISKGPTLGKAAVAALARFARTTGRPELAGLPFVLTGQSRGGVWSRDIALTLPERTIAYANISGWIAKTETEAQRRVPALFVLGNTTTPKEPWRMLTSFRTEFLPGARGGNPWTAALQWGLNEHSSQNEMALLIPFFEAIIRARVRPQGALAPAADAWLGDGAGWQLTLGEPAKPGGPEEVTAVNPAHVRAPAIAAASAFRGDRGAAIWLPDRRTAEVWRALVTPGTRIPLRLSDADGKVLGEGKPRRTIVPVGAAVTVEVSPCAGRGLRLHDGEQILPVRFDRSCKALWRPRRAGAHVLIARWRQEGAEQLSPPELVVARPAPAVP